MRRKKPEPPARDARAAESAQQQIKPDLLAEEQDVTGDCDLCGVPLPMDLSYCEDCGNGELTPDMRHDLHVTQCSSCRDDDDAEVVTCLDCGFASNVTALIMAHDFGHSEDK